MKYLFTILFLLFTLATGAQTSLNVTSYGAVGDAVSGYFNTVSNSSVITTTNLTLSSADVGKSIEVFGCGTQTFGLNSYQVLTNGYQDLVTTITGVANGTNITIAGLPQQTLTNTFGTYGHNNSMPFQNCINAATGPNTIVTIPAGTYLMLTRPINFTHGDGTFWADFEITNGGLTLSGAGTNVTTLLGQGAWTIPVYTNPDSSTNSSPIRGVILAISTPVANDNGFIIENLTFDGGVQHGNIPIRGAYANPVDGLGWDVTHDAICSFGSTAPTFTYQMFTNVSFQHWRGEIMKSTEGSTNGNATIIHCAFYDGDATAINYYPSLFVCSNLFSGVSQIAEYYQAYYTNTSIWTGNVFSNCSAGGIAINGGKGNNPPVVISNNWFYSLGDNSLMTTPGDNVFVIDNVFIAQNIGATANAIVLGANGYQGTFDNSNIVIAANVFTNFNNLLEIAGGSGPTDPERVESVWFTNNTSVGGTLNALYIFNWNTNIFFQNNQIGGDQVDGYPAFYTSYPGIPDVIIPTNNAYWSGIRDTVGVTNILSYSSGSRFQIWGSLTSKSAWIFTNDDSLVPPGTQALFDNENVDSLPAVLYLNNLNGTRIAIPIGTQLAIESDGTQWTTNAVSPPSGGGTPPGTALSSTGVTWSGVTLGQ